MPKISDGVALYNAVGALAAGSTLIGTVPTNNQQANAALYRFWNAKPHTDQYNWDVAAWYGAMQLPGHPSITTFLTKLFTVLREAGVLYDNGTVSGHYQWRDCAADGIPLGAILAHGGRLIIQLPVREEHSDEGTAFFNWLTTDVTTAGLCPARTTATHALSHRAPALPLPGGSRRFRIAEERGKSTGMRGALKSLIGESNHYGVNLALFGSGRTNWFSGNTVNHNGGHGHCYIYFNQKAVGQCAGIMIGGENSGVGAMSQTFVGHGAKAVSEDFSPAGTLKWPAMDHGPNHMVEEFLVDLSDGWQWVQAGVAGFQAAYLDYTPNPVNNAMATTDPRRLVIYALIDLLDAPPGNIGFTAKRHLKAHLETLLKGQNMPRATLTAIIEELAKACGQRNVVVDQANGTYAATPMTTTASLPLQSTITACRTNWASSV